MITINEALSFFNSQQNTYYSLWVFFFTSSAGVVGFVYGNDFARGSIMVKIVASFLYFLIIIGNHHAINSTYQILNETRNSIQVAVSEKSEKVDLTQAVNLLQNSSLSLASRVKVLIADFFYLLSVVFIFSGIWFSGYSTGKFANKSSQQNARNAGTSA